MNHLAGALGTANWSAAVYVEFGKPVNIDPDARLFRNLLVRNRLRRPQGNDGQRKSPFVGHSVLREIIVGHWAGSKSAQDTLPMAIDGALFLGESRASAGGVVSHQRQPALVKRADLVANRCAEYHRMPHD